MPRPLHEIAKEIHFDWKRMSPRAAPYLCAMQELGSIDEKFHEDEGRSVVRYFLANAGSWRGEVARRVKKELNVIVKRRKGVNISHH